jgi:hypothetical protein
MNKITTHIALLVFAGAIPALAQGTATVWGTIHDSSGGVLPGANVSISNEKTGQVRTATAGATGSYLIALLPVGSYSIKVKSSGFKQYVRSGVSLSTDENARIDVLLEIGDLSESVTVTGDANIVETRSATQSLLVDSTRMRQLPLNGRNPLQLQYLLPGVTLHSAEGGAENRGVSNE